MAITITVDEDDFLEMLVDRVKNWTDDEDTIELFEQYYDSMVYGGCFEGTNRSISEIVDNDYVNNTSIITEDEFNATREEYIQQQIESLDKPEEPVREDYEDEEDYESDLTDYKDDMETYKEEVQGIEEDTPTWDDVEAGEDTPDFIDGYRVEAKTDKCLLVSW